jgi:hypothetical protein
MRKLLNTALFIIITTITIGVTDTFARSYTSRRSYSSRRNYSSRRSYKRSNYTRKPTTTQKHTVEKPKTSTSNVKKAKKTSGGFGHKKVDTKSASYKKTNAQIKKDFGTSNKKYKSVKAAKADLGQKMANKTYTYKTSATAMAHRPTYIPTAYHGYPTAYYNGHYGYFGLHNVWIPYLAMHMVINDDQLHSYAPDVYETQRHRHKTFSIVLSIILLLLGIMGFIIALTHK